APVAAPSSGGGAREGAISRGAQQAPAAAAPTEAPAATTPSDSGSSTSTRARPSGGGSSPTASGGSTHVVRRGETLSSIAVAASRLSANPPQPRSWMLPISQANPSASKKNMTLLRSASVLRLPDASDVSSIPPADANSEIRLQSAAWRASAPASSSS